MVITSTPGAYWEAAGFILNPTYAVQDTDIQEAPVDSQDFIAASGPRLMLFVLKSDANGPVRGMVHAVRGGVTHITLCNGQPGAWADLTAGKTIDITRSLFNRRPRHLHPHRQCTGSELPVTSSAPSPVPLAPTGVVGLPLLSAERPARTGASAMKSRMPQDGATADRTAAVTTRVGTKRSSSSQGGTARRPVVTS